MPRANLRGMKEGAKKKTRMKRDRHRGKTRNAKGKTNRVSHSQNTNRFESQNSCQPDAVTRLRGTHPAKKEIRKPQESQRHN